MHAAALVQQEAADGGTVGLLAVHRQSRDGDASAAGHQPALGTTAANDARKNVRQEKQQRQPAVSTVGLVASMDSTLGSTDILLSLNLMPLDRCMPLDVDGKDSSSGGHAIDCAAGASVGAPPSEAAADGLADCTDAFTLDHCMAQLPAGQGLFCDVGAPGHGTCSDITSLDLGSLFSWEVQTAAPAGVDGVTSGSGSCETAGRSAVVAPSCGAEDEVDGRRGKRAVRKAHGRWGPIRAVQALGSDVETSSRASAGKGAANAHVDAGSTPRATVSGRGPSRPGVVGGRSSTGSLACSRCAATFDSHATYRRHCVFKHSQDCRVPCGHCRRTFRRPAGRDEHVRRAHGPSAGAAASAAARASVVSPVHGHSVGEGSSPTAEEEEADGAGAAELRCAVCAQSYATVDALAAHLASPLHFRRVDDGNAVAAAQALTAHHADVLRHCPYQCLLCDFQCSTADCFVDHLKSQRHAEVTDRLVGPTSCERCGFYSYDAADVVAHVIAAADHRQTAAECGGGFGGRRRPLRLCVIGEKRSSVPCRHCGRCCHSATHLARHVRAAHGTAAPATVQAAAGVASSEADCTAASAVTCPHCGWTARSRHNLAVHVRRRHTMERPYPCERCHVAFADKFSLSVHYRTLKHRKAVLWDCAVSGTAHGRPGGPLGAAADAVAVGIRAVAPPPGGTEAPETGASAAAASASSALSSAAVALRLPGTAGTRQQAHARVRCRHCSHWTTSNRAMRQHYLEQHAASSSSCVGRRSSSLQAHRADRSAGQQQQAQAPLAASAKGYVRSQAEDEPRPLVGHKCGHCGRVVVDAVEFEVHRLSHSCATRERDLSETDRLGPMNVDFLRRCGGSRRRLACPECDTRCSGGSSMAVHMRVHSGHRPYSCVVCYARYAEGGQLLAHLREHFVAAEPRRQQRGRLPASGCPLSDHEQRGAGCPAGVPAMQWPLVAGEEGGRDAAAAALPDCQQSSSVSVGPVGRADDDSRHECTVTGCGKTFRDRRGLIVHLRRHRGEKPYTCDDCGYKCASPSERSRHRKVHGSGSASWPLRAAPAHSCDYCPYTAGSAYHLRRHVRVHTGSKPYGCPHCDYRCNTEHNLRKHILQSRRHRGLPVYRCPLPPPPAAAAAITAAAAEAAAAGGAAPPPPSCSFACNAAAELVAHVLHAHGDDPDAAVRAASSAARFAGLLNVAEDAVAVAEGSRVLHPRQRAAAGATCAAASVAAVPIL